MANPVSENSSSQNKVNKNNAAKPKAAPPVLAPGANPSAGKPYVPYEPGLADPTSPATPTSPTSPTSPTTATDPNAPAKLPDLDWASSFFASLGLPPDVVNQVNKIFTQYSDVSSASAAALGYIRGTTWYATTYPGIAEGIKKGIVANEADYRNLLNQQSQIYKQYLGRDVTGAEFAANLTEGAPLSTIGGRLQGAALAGAYGNDWRATLGAFDEAPSDGEVKALGEETAGLDSPLGQQVKRRLDMAHQRMAGVFQGTLAPPSLSLLNGRLSAPGLAAPKPDLAA